MSNVYKDLEKACAEFEDESPKFEMTKEEVEYFVNNIQGEYLKQETYYEVSALIKRMEEFLKNSK